MANRRMFARTVTDSDSFTEMPLTAQALYFHLGLAADDDGFINSPKRIQRGIGAAEDDLKLLAAKGFLIPFASGVVAVTHWRVNNYLRADRYAPTVNQAEFKRLTVNENGVYSLNPSGDMQAGIPDGLPTGIPLGDAVKDSRVEGSRVEGRRDTLSGAGAPIVREVIGYLNAKTGKSFKPTAKATQRAINARAAEGYGLEDFKRVIDNKAAQWLGNPDMSKYLRPETLFCAQHFESYLNERGTLHDDFAEYD